ncbi:MAG: G3E family GTPase [Arcticibacterium sp.]
MFNHEKVEQSAGWIDDLNKDNHTAETEEYGIGSFEFRDNRPFHLQMLCEDMDASKAALAKMVSMSREDNSAVVRLYLAAALQRVPLDSKWKLT